MDSKEFWEMAEVDVEMPTRTIRLELEEVYQHFAQRFRDENGTLPIAREDRFSYPIIELDTTT